MLIHFARVNTASTFDITHTEKKINSNQRIYGLQNLLILLYLPSNYPKKKYKQTFTSRWFFFSMLFMFVFMVVSNSRAIKPNHNFWQTINIMYCNN